MDPLTEVKIALLEGLGGRPSWFALSFFGEADLLLPVAALIAIWLWRRGRVRDAQAWGTSVVLCTITVGLMKLGLGDFKWTVYGHVFNASGFPSGHVATATVFWGGLMLLLAGRRFSAFLLLPIPLVALTVLVLGWHHTLDIVAGFAIGAVSLLPLLLKAPRRSPRSAF
jgi:membrane-associated phospholipid phosphatase